MVVSTNRNPVQIRQRRRQKKRKTRKINANQHHQSSAQDDHAVTPSSSSIKTDFLFGSSKKNKDTTDHETSKSKRRKTTGDSTASKHSLLPLGGGGVVVSTKRRKSKNKNEVAAVRKGETTTITIEALSFSKLAKGTKVLGCVREVHEQYAIVSLPNLLSGYILPQVDPRNGDSALYPLSHTLSVGQVLAVVVMKIATETVSGGGGQTRRRIQVSPLPQLLNPRSLLVGDDYILPDKSSGDGKSKGSIVSSANRLSRSSVPVRGQILSVEDHGCVVDMGFGIRGFVKFENVRNGKDYLILEEDEDEPVNDDDVDDDEENEKHPVILQKGRIYDFLVLPVTTTSKDQSTTIFPLSLPSDRSFAKETVSSLTTTGNDKNTTNPFTLSSLTPGWLVQVKVEALATNGLCVSFLGNVFRGSLEMNHLGATLLPDAKDGAAAAGPDGGWKQHAASLFQKHQYVSARILAVDVPTKLVRLSMAPHVLKLGNVAEVTSPLTGFPDVGAVVPDCTVVKLDPGIGALLALPPQFNYSDDKEALIPKSFVKSSELFGNPEFQEACHVRKVYVHISKALDEANEEDLKDSAVIGKFHKEFAPSTKHTVRILNTGHWMEGVAAGGCAQSIIDAHVLTHSDLEAGKVYKQVPVCAHLKGGSVMVQLGGSSSKKKKGKKSSRESTSSGISGLIPPLQLFDTSTGSEFRQRVFNTKYAVDAKVDVRVLWVDPVRKRCLVTAKKTIVQAPAEKVITSYTDVSVGQVAVGYISKIEDDGMFVTFCNKVYGKVTARSLAADLGVEDHKDNYKVGDVVTCRVVKAKRTVRKGSRSSKDDEEEMEIDEAGEDGSNINSNKKSRREYWKLILSLKVQGGDEDEDDIDENDVDVRNPKEMRLQAGAILPAKSMKIVQLVDGTQQRPGKFIPGYAVVTIKSKHLVSKDLSADSKMIPEVECKLPFSQLLDSYDPADVADAVALDAFAQNVLKVGKKINQKGIILFDPHKSDVDYSTGIGKMPIVSLRKSLIQTKLEEEESESLDAEKTPIVPLPSSDLFVGALVTGFVAQVDPRHGAFVRFLDGMTGLVHKKNGGIKLRQHETVVTRIKAIDDSCRPHRILLEPVSGFQKPTTSFKVGDKLAKAVVSKINFHRASLKIAGPDTDPQKERVFIHCTNKESSPSVIRHRKKPLTKQENKNVISKNHPFYGMKIGQEVDDLTVIFIRTKKDHVEIFVTDKEVDSDENMSPENEAPLCVEKASDLKPGMKVTAVVVGHGQGNKGVYVQVGPYVKGFVSGLELSRDLDVLNNLEANIPTGAVLECVVLNTNGWYDNRLKCPFPSFYQKNMLEAKEKHSKDASLNLSVLANNSGSLQFSTPSKGELIIGRANKGLPSIHSPSLMLDLRGGFVARCCITEVEEQDEWENMPLGHIHPHDNKKKDGARKSNSKNSAIVVEEDDDASSSSEGSDSDEEDDDKNPHDE